MGCRGDPIPKSDNMPIKLFATQFLQGKYGYLTLSACEIFNNNGKQYLWTDKIAQITKESD